VEIGDPLPRQWQVVLTDGSTIGVWSGCYGEADGYYTFEILADAAPEEQADDDLVIAGRTPSNPERILLTVARIPIGLVATIWTRPWDHPVTAEDLVPTEWDPRPQ